MIGVSRPLLPPMAYSSPFSAAPCSDERAVGIDAFVSQVPLWANALEAHVNATRATIIVASLVAFRVFISVWLRWLVRWLARFYGNCRLKYSTSFPQR